MLDNNKRISVIMGIYNCQDTLKESIQSILNQTYTNWELIMCDDCSIDNTYNIAKYYADKFPEKIKLIKNDKNLTLAPTLNKCLELATGDYIARQDGDDLSLKNRFEKQIEFLEKNKEYDLVGSAMVSFDENGEIGIRGVQTEYPDKFELLTTTPFCHATIICKRKVFEELNGYRVTKYTRRCEDVDLWFRFFEKEFKGCNLTEALYKVRDDDASYKRRTFRNYFNIFVVNFRGYNLLKMPIRKYVYLIKPLITPFIPTKILRLYHRNK